MSRLDVAGLRPEPSQPDSTLVERFAAGDAAAFSALVDRHGPLVLGVCRRVLGRSPLTDDAFQATFLVLARKAAGLRNPEGLPSWLFGVARRVANAARRSEARHARAVREKAPPEPRGEWDELLKQVDEELDRLPEKLRAPVVLCLYHGKTQDEAAAALGWSLSTLRRRLDRGRELLKARLTSRGATLAGGLLAGSFAPSASATVPFELKEAAVEVAVAEAVGGVPAGLGALAGPGTVAPAAGKLALVGGVGLACALAGGVAWLVLQLKPVPAVPTAAPPANAGPPLTPPELMANPWVDPLPKGAVARLGTTAFRHGGGGAFGVVDPVGVTQLGFTPDGALVTVGGSRVRFWDTTTGRELHADEPGISTRLTWVIRAHVLDGGRKLVLPDSDPNGFGLPSVTVWNLTTRKPLRQVLFQRHEGRKSTHIAPTAVSHDATRFAELDGNGDTWVWGAEGEALCKLDGRVAEFSPQTFVSGGRELLTRERDQPLRFFDTATGHEHRVIVGAYPRQLASACSPDGTRVATLGLTGAGEPGEVDRYVRVWDAATGTLAAQFRLDWLGGSRGTQSREGVLLFTPDGREVVLVGSTFGEGVLDVESWPLDGSPSTRWRARWPHRRPHPVAVSADGRLLAVGPGGEVRLFDRATGRERRPPPGHTGGVQSAHFSDDGRSVRTDSSSEGLVWDLATGQSRAPQSGPRVEGATPDVDRSFLDRGGFHDLIGHRPMMAFGEPGRWPKDAPLFQVTASRYTPDGAAVVVGGSVLPLTPTDAGRVYVVDLTTLKVRWQASFADAAPSAVVLSPDGTRVAVGTTVVRVFDAATGKVLATFDGHRGAVTALSFDHDGRRLVSGSADTTAVVWELP